MKAICQFKILGFNLIKKSISIKNFGTIPEILRDGLSRIQCSTNTFFIDPEMMNGKVGLGGI